MLELKANPNRAGKGCVLEARLDKTRGPIATLLVQNGTLHQGDLIIAGTAVGRVRVMTNDKGLSVKDAGPSIPVEITGLTEVPAPGDEFNAVADERMARQLVEQRKQKIKDDANKLNQKVTLESLFSKLQEGEMKELNLIVKADVQGSAEAVKASLEKISNEEVRVKRHPRGRRRDQRVRYPAGFHIQRDRRRLQRPPERSGAGRGQARQGRYPDVPRHLRRDQ